MVRLMLGFMIDSRHWSFCLTVGEPKFIIITILGLLELALPREFTKCPRSSFFSSQLNKMDS